MNHSRQTNLAGSISMIPVKAIPHHLREKDQLSNAAPKMENTNFLQVFCEEGDEVPKSEITFGYKLKGHDYLVFDKKEITSAKPISSKLIELDKFIEFFEVDPHYFERTFLLIPNNSEKPYALLRKVLETAGLAAIGKITISTKEHTVLDPLLPECYHCDHLAVPR